MHAIVDIVDTVDIDDADAVVVANAVESHGHGIYAANHQSSAMPVDTPMTTMATTDPL